MSNENGFPNCARLGKALVDLQARFEELERKFAAAIKPKLQRMLGEDATEIVVLLRPRPNLLMKSAIKLLAHEVAAEDRSRVQLADPKSSPQAIQA